MQRRKLKIIYKRKMQQKSSCYDSDGTIGQINEGESAAAATSGNLFHYDTETDQYIYNWSTRGQTPGTYRLFIDLGDGVERSEDIGLR
jgi:hypothetical protein